ncbi:MAG TPA: phosphate acyltransferase [Pirellulales bacterium]|nr:phosphate acyltransferase [Pirellulales bacterium]
MSLPSFDDLFADADRHASRVGVAVAGADDNTVLAALRLAVDRGWVEPFLCGDESDIRGTADTHAISIDGFRFIGTTQPAHAAVAAVRDGRARLLMKGRIATPELMSAVLAADTGLRTGRVICQTPLVEIVSAGRRLLMADTGVCVQPTIEQRIDILRSTVALAHALGVAQPRVALMAATETPTVAMPDTIEAAEIVRRHHAGEITGCQIQGPLSFDLAYAAEAGDRKRLAGPVVGAADVMIFPNLTAANLTIKAIMYTAPCRFGGVLSGAACPVVFMSRADNIETRLHSLALALKLTVRPFPLPPAEVR